MISPRTLTAISKLIGHAQSAPALLGPRSELPSSWFERLRQLAENAEAAVDADLSKKEKKIDTSCKRVDVVPSPAPFRIPDCYGSSFRTRKGDLGAPPPCQGCPEGVRNACLQAAIDRRLKYDLGQDPEGPKDPEKPDPS